MTGSGDGPWAAAPGYLPGDRWLVVTGSAAVLLDGSAAGALRLWRVLSDGAGAAAAVEALLRAALDGPEGGLSGLGPFVLAVSEPAGLRVLCRDVENVRVRAADGSTMAVTGRDLVGWAEVRVDDARELLVGDADGDGLLPVPGGVVRASGVRWRPSVTGEVEGRDRAGGPGGALGADVVAAGGDVDAETDVDVVAGGGDEDPGGPGSEEALEPELADVEPVQPGSVEPGSVDPVEPDSVDPEQVDAEQVDPEQVDPEQVDPEQVDAEPCADRAPAADAVLDAVPGVIAPGRDFAEVPPLPDPDPLPPPPPFVPSPTVLPPTGSAGSMEETRYDVTINVPAIADGDDAADESRSGQRAGSGDGDRPAATNDWVPNGRPVGEDASGSAESAAVSGGAAAPDVPVTAAPPDGTDAADPAPPITSVPGPPPGAAVTAATADAVVPMATPAGDHDGLTELAENLPIGYTPPPVGDEMPPGTVLAALCPSGHANAPHSSTCRLCGQPVAEADPVPVQRPVLARIRLSTGEVVDLDRPVVLGRAPYASRVTASELPRLVTVPSPHQDISRAHAQIRATDWQVVVADLDSTNGTTVRPPGRAPLRLHPGQEIVVEAGWSVELGDEISFVVEALS